MKNLHLYFMNKKAIVLCFVLFNIHLMNAQDDKIKFGAYARALQQSNTLGKSDTLNPDNTSKGNVLLDLGLNINPDKKTEIQAIIRFNNNFSGFYTAGASASLRQLYVKGIVGKYFNYQVGDLYLKLTPYTFFNNNAEGSVNEAGIFSDLRRDYTNYENLSNRGNAWWQQGAATNFAISFSNSIIDTLKVDAFFLRNRASYAQLPSSFHAGGKITVTQGPRLKLAFNYLDLYDLGSNVKIDSLAKSNPVGSGEIDLKIINGKNVQLALIGEGGFSSYVFKGDTAQTKSGFFYDAGLQLNLKPQNLIVTANYTYVDPLFYSAAAQTKRVNYGNTPTTLANYGNDPKNIMTRGITVFDLVRDPSVYNQGIVRNLMAYNPIYGNAQPYGKATPNRTGIELNVQYKDSLQKIVADVDAAFLSDIVGEGSAELRSFIVLKGGIDFNIHKFFDWKKRLILTTGYKFESTNRGGDALQAVSLVNNLVDLGLEIEAIKKFSFLVGFKMLTAQGNEFVAVRNQYNDITNYTPMANINVAQNIFAFGLKYRFSDKTYLTVQNHMFDYKDNTTATNNYSINQVLVMFNMNF